MLLRGGRRASGIWRGGRILFSGEKLGWGGCGGGLEMDWIGGGMGMMEGEEGRQTNVEKRPFS